MSDTVALPMLATIKPTPISFQRMKRIFAYLTVPGQQERLATDLPYLEQQAGVIYQAALHLQKFCATEKACKQLLRKEPQLLPQLTSLTAAALQQLATQLDRELKVSRTAAVLTGTLSAMLPAVRASHSESQSPSAADAATLAMLHERGLLQAYTAAAVAAASTINSSPPAPRANPTQPAKEAMVQLMNNPAHVFAAASSSVLMLWNNITDLMPPQELLAAGSLLLDTALPSATLAMALARAYAGDHAFCASVMFNVLPASHTIARAAVAQPTDTYYGVLARQGVYELLLLGFAVYTGLLHAGYKGVSKQSLLPSMRAASSSSSSNGGSCSRGRSSASSSSKANKNSKAGRLAVSAHHEELLQALLGVRQLAALQDSTASTLLETMWLVPHAVCKARRVRHGEAYELGQSSHSMGRGELVLPLLLTQVELLALVPPLLVEQRGVLQLLLSDMPGDCHELHAWTRTLCRQQQQQQQPQQEVPSLPCLEVVQAHMWLLVQSVWLQLGPALLALCHRSSGEAVGEDQEGQSGIVFTSASGQPLRAAPPRQVYATFSEMLMTALRWQLEDSDEPTHITVNLEAVVQQNPLLACSVLEAALHVAPDYKLTLAADFSSSDGMLQASATCCAAASALPILAEVIADAASQHADAPAAALEALLAEVTAGPGAAAAAAAPGPSSDSSKLEQKFFCLLVAAVKYAMFCATLTPPAGPLEHAVLELYYNSITLLGASINAVFTFLGPEAVVAATFYESLLISMDSPLLWLQVLGRVLLAAGQLLQQVPQFVTATGSFVCVDGQCSAVQQSSTYSSFTLMLGRTVERLHSMLLQGGEAAAAAAAGSPAAAANPTNLARLPRLAADLQQQLDPMAMAFYLSRHDAQGTGVSAAMQQLYTACQDGGLPQKLYGFGVACCAAFPQRGCCGNPACTNLDKFTETALASQGCSGCNKAVKFCSPACHKTAWKQGHKEACAVLKQRRAAGATTEGA